jgi:hypothetical protein
MQEMNQVGNKGKDNLLCCPVIMYAARSTITNSMATKEHYWRLNLPLHLDSQIKQLDVLLGQLTTMLMRLL